MPVRRVRRAVRAPAEPRRRYAARRVPRVHTGTAVRARLVLVATIAPDFQMFKTRRQITGATRARPQTRQLRRHRRLTRMCFIHIRRHRVRWIKPQRRHAIQSVINPGTVLDPPLRIVRHIMDLVAPAVISKRIMCAIIPRPANTITSPALIYITAVPWPVITCTPSTAIHIATQAQTACCIEKRSPALPGLIARAEVFRNVVPVRITTNGGVILVRRVSIVQPSLRQAQTVPPERTAARQAVPPPAAVRHVR